MTPAELLADLQNSGASVYLDRGKLIVNAPAGTLTFAQVGRIKTMKADLMDLLDWDAGRAKVLRDECTARISRAMPDDFEFPEDLAEWRRREQSIAAAIDGRNLPAMRTALQEYEDFARDEFGRWREAKEAVEVDVFDFESLPIPKYN